VETTGGDGDVDLHRQEAGPGQGARRAPEAAVDDGLGRFDAALSQPEQRQPAAGPAAEALGGAERLLGPIELTQPAADVADLGEGHRAVRDMAVAELLAGPL